MTVKAKDLLNKIRQDIKPEEELNYFLIHQLRYQFILDQIFKLNLPPGAKILDVGCFPLHLFNALKLAGYDLYGISSQHEPVKDQKIVISNIETDKLTYKENFFDLVLFSEVMEHLLYSPKIYLQKFYSVLKPKGFLFLTTPNAVHLKHRLQTLVGKNPYFPLFQIRDSLYENGYIYHRHNREYTLGELHELLEESGFKIHSSGFFNAYSPFREKLHPEKTPVKIIKGLAFGLTYLSGSLKDTIYILAQKI